MPDYEHVCRNEECKHEWEDSYSIKKDPPKECPKCHQQTAERIISLNGRGVVELSGSELTDKLKSDVQQLKRDASKNEKLHANLVGETKYQDLQSSIDRGRRGY